MPYIKKDDREKYDPILEELIDRILENCSTLIEAAGVLNYCTTQLFVAIASTIGGKFRYWHAALLSGVLDNIKMEFYRRKVAPYEDEKIQENGDVTAYE